MEVYKTNKLGAILLKSKKITPRQLKAALIRQEEERKRLGIILTEMGLIRESDIVKAFSEQLNVPYVDLESTSPDPEVLTIITDSMAKRHLVLPLEIFDGKLKVAMADPIDNQLKNALKFATNKNIEACVSSPTDILKAVRKFYNGITPAMIGDILLENSIITQEQLNNALEIQKDTNKKVGAILLEQGFISEKDLVHATSKQLGIEYIDLSIVQPEQEAIDLVPKGLAETHLIFPLVVRNLILVISMSDPLDLETINALSLATDRIVKVNISTPTEIREAINKHYKGETSKKLGSMSVSNEMVSKKAHSKQERKKIGDILVEVGSITDEQLEESLEKQKTLSKKLGEILVDMGVVSESDIALAFSRQLGLTFENLEDVHIDKNVLQMIPFELASRYLVLPLRYEKRELTITISNPLDSDTIDAIAFYTGKKINVVVSTTIEIRKALERFYNKKERKLLGDILVEMGVVSKEDLDLCIESYKGSKVKFGDMLINEGLATEIDIQKALSVQVGIPFVDLTKEKPTESALNIFSHDMADKFAAMPLNVDKNKLCIVMADPLNIEVQKEIRRLIGKSLVVKMSTKTMIKEAIANGYLMKDDLQDIVQSMEVESVSDAPDYNEEQEEEDIISNVDAAPIVRLVNNIIIKAKNDGVSDIHIEPYKDSLLIRYRIDGELRDISKLPKSMKGAVVSRIKILSKLDISERRLPQDGKIKLMINKKPVELRVATLPIVNGETVVMRILAAQEPMPIDKLALSESNLKSLKNILPSPYGLILVVGPTGSGKTTTLHSVLGELNTPDKKIWTAEDPVEITQARLNQLEVKPKIKLDFARAMRAFLRADPDIIMVGEMRDLETAAMGVEASLTGHLVLSTLHTNTAPETITRLIDVGLDPFNFADALMGVLAQRLVRTLCKSCKKAYNPMEEEFQFIVDTYGADLFHEIGVKSAGDAVFYAPDGCHECANTGYRGRMGIHELLVGTEEVKRLIQRKAPIKELREVAINEGMRTLLQDGILKVFQGHTDMKQVRKVAM